MKLLKVFLLDKRSLLMKSFPFLRTGITKPCTHLHPAPSTSIQLHPPPPNLFQSLPSSLQHPQKYLNQNIAHNWAISPRFGQKIKSCSFWLKIGTHGILEVLIPNPDLDFWNSDPKIHFWANLDRKSQSCLVWLKIGTQSVSTMLILIPTLFFSVSNPKSFFGQIWAEKFKVVHFDWKLAHMVYRGCWFLFRQ